MGNDRVHEGADSDDVNGVTGATPTSTTTTQELPSNGERETRALKKMLRIGKVLRAALAEIQDGPLESCDTSISSIVNDRRFSKRDWGEASKTACEKKFERKVWGALDECDAKQIFKMCGLYFKRSWKKSIVSPSFAFLVGVTSQFCQKELGWATDTALDWAQVEGNKKKSKTKKGSSPLNEPVPPGLDIIIHVFFRLLYCTPEISKHVQSYVTAQRKRFTYHTKTQAQVLARALNSTFGVNLELLEFLGVTKENLEAAEYNPHDENGEIVQVRVTEDKLEPFAPATVSAQTKASLFNWTNEHSFNTEAVQHGGGENLGGDKMGNASGVQESGKVSKKASLTARLSLRKSIAPVDYDAVRADILSVMDSTTHDDGSYAPVLIRLGWHSSGTFDAADGTGGSNGATMRFSPEIDDPENRGLEVARELLTPIKKKHPGISYSDLWILAAYAALEHTGGPVITFEPGRTDKAAKHAIKPGRLPEAEHGILPGVDDEGRANGWENLAQHLRDVFGRMGFDDRETAALLCGGHVYGRCHPEHSGYNGAWVEEPTKFSNEYAADLIGDEWMHVEHDTTVEGVPIPEETRPAPGKRQYMTAWSPSQEAEALAEVEVVHAEECPPGRYRVVDDWINVRRTHDPSSDTIDQPKEGQEFNVVVVRKFGNAVRGQLDVGGWASIVSSSGEALMERIGDLEIAPALFRVAPGVQSRVLVKDAPDAEDGQALSDTVVEVEEVDTSNAAEDQILLRLADGRGWISLVDEKFGALLERIEEGYNEEPRKALPNGGLLQVKFQMMLVADMVMAWDEGFRKHVEEYAEDVDLLRQEFGDAYKKLTQLGVPMCPGMKSSKA
ncbi:Cytochrome c peroxidase, mitochondrial [Hondaea fermentalgiana]|uniref:Cytochrome c peroxidase, mitochondrial n=1 Tax=Hondaea fermentalgiana TaxID=2315210 RepID=A0A2R5GPT2_9STRA|nr:Cytochrome c peroxidase, mitochondrial [Hondaea fermentalgiana]|eukprot:GBG29894.1 Cytochrome c peroxidase, mitochondrial [Hondaea fermentalgiana]